MSNLSDFYESGILNHLFRNSTLSKPSAIGVALTHLVPSDSDTGASIDEIVHGNGYNRLSASGDGAWFNIYQLNNSGVIETKVALTWPQCTGADWGWVSGIALCDATGDAGGNLIMWSQLTNPVNVTVGSIFSLASGDLEVRCA